MPMLLYTFGMAGHFHSRFVSIAGAAAILILLSGCGGDDEATVGTVPPASITPSTVAPATTTTTTSTIATTTTETPNLVGSPEFDTTSSVSTVGIDAVIFGMTVARAERAVEGSFVPVSEPINQACHQVRPAGGPLGVLLTVTAGTVERVDIINPDITTRSGAGVGMSEDGLASLFGERLTTESSNTGGNRIVFTPSDPGDADFRVIFETDGAVVTSFRSGRLPQVEPTTPCT
ncbi:MAG: hypothetical protein ACI81L_002796 [Verrucomicrobiales bacterium]|jgi:hypothetical protein